MNGYSFTEIPDNAMTGLLKPYTMKILKINPFVVETRYAIPNTENRTEASHINTGATAN
jgi:hypothetical protein